MLLIRWKIFRKTDTITFSCMFDFYKNWNATLKKHKIQTKKDFVKIFEEKYLSHE